MELTTLASEAFLFRECLLINRNFALSLCPSAKEPNFLVNTLAVCRVRFLAVAIERASNRFKAEGGRKTLANSSFGEGRR